MRANMSMQSLFRAIADDLDVHVGGDPKSEQDHDALIERAIAGELPVTESAGAIFYTLRWLQDHGILALDPDHAGKYQPPPEWQEG